MLNDAGYETGIGNWNENGINRNQGNQDNKLTKRPATKASNALVISERQIDAVWLKTHQIKLDDKWKKARVKGSEEE